MAGEADLVADSDAFGDIPGIGGVGQDFSLDEGFYAAFF